MIQPETQFTNVGGDRVAYQVLGEGPRDVLYTTGFWNHLDIEWEEPGLARFYRRLASFARLIRFDRRGTGVSDQPADDGLSAVEHWLQDCVAVLDTVGSEAPVIYGEGMPEVGPLVLQHADRHPDRYSALVLINTGACPLAMADYPEGLTAEAIHQLKDDVRRTWGTLEFAAGYAPSRVNDESFQRWVKKLMRSIATPRAVVGNIDLWDRLDCRSVLPRIHAPTLVMASANFPLVPFNQARYLSEHISGARFVELPGSDGLLAWAAPHYVDQIEEFVTGRRHGGEPDRVLTTVLFTDIVGSTRRAAEMGDAAWRKLLDRHDQSVREQIAFHRGRFIESSGDGTLATFNSPDHAIDCGLALHKVMAEMDLTLRTAVHFGQIELREDGRVGGISVHIGARVMALAGAGEVLVSRTVRDILIGSRYEFQDRGTHTLKGVPERWPLYAVRGLDAIGS